MPAVKISATAIANGSRGNQRSAIHPPTRSATKPPPRPAKSDQRKILSALGLGGA